MNNFKKESSLNGTLKEPPKFKISFNERVKSISLFWLFISLAILLLSFSYRRAQNEKFKQIRLSIDTMRFYRFNEKGQLAPIEINKAEPFKIP